MRSVNRSYLLQDAAAIFQEQSTIDLSNQIAHSGIADNISRQIYSDPYNGGIQKGMQSRVIDKLNQWYFGKCAYCERFYKLDVEHFRPKGEIRDRYNTLISPIGYYWLGYEWSNLLPCCISCNRDGGKNSKFPFLAGGVQVTNPTFDNNGLLDRNFCLVNNANFIQEFPMMLNPEVDQNLESYFDFEIDQDLKGVSIIGIDPNNRGTVTIEICKLNREETRRDRLQNVIKDFANLISVSVNKFRLQNNTEHLITDIELLIQKLYNDRYDPELSHTLLRRYIVRSPNHFDKIVSPFIIQEFKAVLSMAFRNYQPV